MLSFHPINFTLFSVPTEALQLFSENALKLNKYLERNRREDNDVADVTLRSWLPTLGNLGEDFGAEENERNVKPRNNAAEQYKYVNQEVSFPLSFALDFKLFSVIRMYFSVF